MIDKTDDALGLTTIEHAAIALRVPQSGTPWLDDMIRQARRMDLAQAAMAVCLAQVDTFPDEHWRVGVAKDAYLMADAMIRKGEKE